jgi:amino acid permease
MALVLAIGIFITAVGAAGVVAPHILQSISQYTATQTGLYVAAVLRIVIGVALFRAAAASRAPRLLRGLGVIAIAAGIGTLFLGVDRAGAILAWWSSQGPVFIRLWPALALVLGVIVVWAVIPRRRAA